MGNETIILVRPDFDNPTTKFNITID